MAPYALMIENIIVKATRGGSVIEITPLFYKAYAYCLDITIASLPAIQQMQELKRRSTAFARLSAYAH